MAPYFGMLGCGYQIGDQKKKTKKNRKNNDFFFFGKITPSFPTKKTKQIFNNFCRPTTVDDGSHNVSRWMTWLPISLKNAAKCDKWYQLQNHSITESLNAKGAWEKLFTSHPRAYRILSVEQKTFFLRLCVHSQTGLQEV